MIKIKVAYPAGLQEIELPEGATVRDALVGVGASHLERYFILVNGTRKSQGAVLKDKDIVVAVLPVRGGATVKSDGNVWRVHPNDKDGNFPSDFHAHNIENGQVLDIYTGDIYDPGSKQILRKLSKTVMLTLYNKLKNRGNKIITAKCNDDPVRFKFLERTL